jgi:hypothetical protein
MGSFGGFLSTAAQRVSAFTNDSGADAAGNGAGAAAKPRATTTQVI